MVKIENTYARLPERFFARVKPARIANPRLIQWNAQLAQELGIEPNKDNAAVFSGQAALPGGEPIAMAYAGHQFGNFVPQLGDGRALLLAEVVTPRGQRFDIHLKGSGQTPFSRGGDGKAALGPVLREYIVSEAMHRLGIPTTRSLAVITTGEEVQRDEPLPGAVLARVAASHIRIGTFEYFASRDDLEGVKILLGYTIKRHFPELEEVENNQLLLLQKVIERQASLLAQWMCVGFIHGVMNTDNSLISGETIDYGPCAFMDQFNFTQVYSSIDRHGRYAYIRQPSIAQWNLARLADCLLMTEVNPEAMVAIYEETLAQFTMRFEVLWTTEMRRKLGLLDSQPDDVDLIRLWLEYLQIENLDFTNSFRDLAERLSGKPTNFNSTPLFNEFESRWRKRIKEPKDSAGLMNSVNPIYIPRNHLVETAIQAALSGNYGKFQELNEVLENPFHKQAGKEGYARPPSPAEKVTATFCGT